MKNLILMGALLLLSMVSFGQETEFKFTREGFTDFVVTSIDSAKQNDLYKKTLEWVQVNYNTPSEVLKGQIENQYIRIEGVSKNALCIKSFGTNTCSSVKYQIEISFKDGKYKFDVIELSQYYTGGWYKLYLDAPKLYYKDNGEIRPVYSQYPENIENVFNSLNKSLEAFLKSEKATPKTDW
jgi:hypothetical protein